MKNSNLAVYIAASLLIISVGMYFYTSSQSTINDSVVTMSTMEIEAFNSQFTIYGGKQIGSKLKALMGTLIANANTYRDEINKLPEVIAEVDLDEKETAEIVEESEYNDYVEKLGNIRNSLENKHTYNVSFDYDSKGIINKITIDY